MPKIGIVTASDRNYLPAACCLLKSAHDHLGLSNAALFFLVLCDVSDRDRCEAELFFAARGVDVNIIEPKAVAEGIVPVKGTKWPRAAYLRLYFDHVFDSSFERLIYLDSDTRVCAPIEPLLKVDLRGQPVGAVHDFIYYTSGNIHRCRKNLSLQEDSGYLQSGVMVFDWPKTLAMRGLERARRFLTEHPERCREAPDQDALNVAFEGQWTPLDPRWNLHELYLTYGGRLAPFIEHYTSTKPWSKYRPLPWRKAAEWYIRELNGTAWSGFIRPQRPVDRLLVQIKFLKYHYTRKLRDLLADGTPFLLDWLGLPRAGGRMDKALPWAPRGRSDVEAMANALIMEAERRCPPLRPPEAVLEGLR